MRSDATTPDQYLAGLSGWQLALVRALRDQVRAAASLQEGIKWGHLVYEHNGPVLLIRAEAERVLFGFWRGQRLREIEPRLRPGGKYEMARVELREGDVIDPAVVARLAKRARELNEELGDPRAAAR